MGVCDGNVVSLSAVFLSTVCVVAARNNCGEWLSGMVEESGLKNGRVCWLYEMVVQCLRSCTQNGSSVLCTYAWWEHAVEVGRGHTSQRLTDAERGGNDLPISAPITSIGMTKPEAIILPATNEANAK